VGGRGGVPPDDVLSVIARGGLLRYRSMLGRLPGHKTASRIKVFLDEFLTDRRDSVTTGWTNLEDLLFSAAWTGSTSPWRAESGDRVYGSEPIRSTSHLVGRGVLRALRGVDSCRLGHPTGGCRRVSPQSRFRPSTGGRAELPRLAHPTVDLSTTGSGFQGSALGRGSGRTPTDACLLGGRRRARGNHGGVEAPEPGVGLVVVLVGLVAGAQWHGWRCRPLVGPHCKTRNHPQKEFGSVVAMISGGVLGSRRFTPGRRSFNRRPGGSPPIKNYAVTRASEQGHGLISGFP